MKPQVEVALVCLFGLIGIQQICCDELTNTSSTKKWICTCSSLPQVNKSNVLGYNCSTSCDCTSATLSGDKWICTCAADGFPKVAIDSHDTNCFTSCNCTSGFVNEAQASKKHISSRVVVIILLICVVLTTLALLASLICYVCRKEKCPIQPPVFSSDAETSCNSATNLICHKISSVQETRIDIGSPIYPGTGCFQKASFLFRSKRGALFGTITRFSFSELEYATDKFSHPNLIGLGGCSYVYRGELKDGRTVAVKRLKTQGGPDADSVFSTEVEVLSRLHHCHVVPLIGYCSEFQGKHAERLLVFEYMPNGNLRDCLDGVSGENMSWDTRVAIAIGAARGLEYLHDAAAPRILHRDVKSTNILLDEKWRAKITDLGMAKRLRADGVPSCSNSPARMQGTFGYFAPEYAIVGRASLKSDVFSYGVVLLELLTGREPIHKSTNKGEESLVIWATPRLQDSRRVSELPDPRLKGNFPEEEMLIMAYLAKECLLLDPDARPTMSDVVQILLTIAPDKSKRMNIPVNLFQMSPPCNIGAEPCLGTTENQLKSDVDGEELKQPALDIDHSPCEVNDEKEGEEVSVKYIERLILLSSNARSCRVPDDETVDLTEPRLGWRGRDRRDLTANDEVDYELGALHHVHLDCNIFYFWDQLNMFPLSVVVGVSFAEHQAVCIEEMDAPPSSAPLLEPPPPAGGGFLDSFLWVLCCCGLFASCCPPLVEPTGPPAP